MVPHQLGPGHGQRPTAVGNVTQVKGQGGGQGQNAAGHSGGHHRALRQALGLVGQSEAAAVPGSAQSHAQTPPAQPHAQNRSRPSGSVTRSQIGAGDSGSVTRSTAGQKHPIGACDRTWKSWKNGSNWGENGRFRIGSRVQLFDADPDAAADAAGCCRSRGSGAIHAQVAAQGRFRSGRSRPVRQTPAAWKNPARIASRRFPHWGRCRKNPAEDVRVSARRTRRRRIGIAGWWTGSRFDRSAGSFRAERGFFGCFSAMLGIRKRKWKRKRKWEESRGTSSVFYDAQCAVQQESGVAETRFVPDGVVGVVQDVLAAVHARPPRLRPPDAQQPLPTQLNFNRINFNCIKLFSNLSLNSTVIIDCDWIQLIRLVFIGLTLIELTLIWFVWIEFNYYHWL